MKLRLEADKICFRLDFPELERLLDRGEIQERTDLPEGGLTYRIICSPQGTAPSFKTDGEHFTLSLARDVIEEHKAALPSLKGIGGEFSTQNGGRLAVTLEVNLKKKLKHSLRQ